MASPHIEHIYSIFLQHRQICTDTRKIRESGLFFALRGDHFNGNEFALAAIEAGAAYAIVDDTSLAEHPRFIFVDNVLETLQQLARHHRLQCRARVLAITGTNGKTTTKELIAQVLSTGYNIIFTQGNLNNHIGVPLTLLTIEDDTDIAIIEMGASHIGEIADYCSWALPDMGLITNIGKAHLEGFGGIEGIKKAKGELYEFLSQNSKTIFRFTADPHLTEMGSSYERTVTYGWADADVTAENLTGRHFAELKVTHPDDLTGLYSSRLTGSYNAPNILCAITVGHFFQVGREHIRQAISGYIPDNLRSQLLEINSNTIIVDAYNANPTSMTAAIEHFYHQQYDHKIICLGGMKELGEESDNEHRVLVDKMQQMGFKQVYLVGREFEKHHASYPYFETSRELQEHFLQHPVSHSTILIKGSRGSQMEVILDAFK